ncbi:replication initiation protein RepC [Sphingomonas vulcanisoli]|uniref:Replication initiation protein RepC n=1 Tax=Sphingomonas vulcanisoli TaxID=1658060 RepID=A0ABX0TV11_9SPHN|nr:plasmid replication protein RepC [Sphingomonas vulcanisoli]NIJ09362.1 replication initiation protein RepC [Sphingomonas vulcanisoli]
MAYACSPGSGFRRFDAFAAQAEQTAGEFRGLPADCGPAQALAAFKRAAPYMQIPAGVVQLIDVLFAWTTPLDWRGGANPIVWPRNEKLARKLGLGVRQLQNLLDRAIRLRLISHLDSPNGHRGGQRNADGTIKWAYGIVLAPIGTRIEDFRQTAARGMAEDAAIDALKKRLGAVRRRISSLAQTAIDHMLVGTAADEELALVLSATRQMKNVRDIDLLTGCVEQMEQRGRALEAEIAAALVEIQAEQMQSETNIITCSDADECTHSTTTTEPQTANAVTSSGFPEGSRGEGFAQTRTVASSVEEDLEKHGVDPAFIESVSPELCHSLRHSQHGWGDVIHLAERLADQAGIHKTAWHEARRVMGERGAAASVIATVHKYHAGDVRQPGAYLRGMNGKAQKGTLHLGRTFHGLKDNRQSHLMRAMHDGPDPRAMGDLARRAMALVLSGRTS